jgi:hypothetical protein
MSRPDYLRRAIDLALRLMHEPDEVRRSRMLSSDIAREFGVYSERVGAPAELTVDPIGSSSCCDELRDFTSLATAREPPLELRLVSYGVKDVALYYGADGDLRSLGGWATGSGLVAALSPYEYVMAQDAGKGGYSNLARRRPISRPSADMRRAIIVARTGRDAALAWLALVLEWREMLGKLLGYPDCCRAAYEARWKIAAQRHQGDVAIRTLLESGEGPFNWRMNIFGRYFGYELLQHFPCSFRCRPSLGLAMRYHSVLEDREPEHARWLTHLLRSPILYTDFGGVFMFPDAQIRVSGSKCRVTFDPAKMLSTVADGSVVSTLRQWGYVVADREHETFRVGEDDAVAYLAMFDGE